MELEPPRTPERPPTPRAADPPELERMRARVRELEGRLGAVESEKGELERENTLIKALLPPLSPAAQALMSLAAGGTPGGFPGTGPEAVPQAPARGRARRPAHVRVRRAGPANLRRDALRELRRETLRRRGVRALRLERQAAQDVHDVQGAPDLTQGRDAITPSRESSEIVEDPRSYPPR